MTSNNLFY